MLKGKDITLFDYVIPGQYCDHEDEQTMVSRSTSMIMGPELNDQNLNAGAVWNGNEMAAAWLIH